MQNIRILRTKRKTLAIEIRPDGSVWVRSPLRLPDNAIQAAIRERQEWIEKKVREVFESQSLTPAHTFQEGEKFLFRGEEYPLLFTEHHRPSLRLEKNCFFLSRKIHPKARAVFESWYRAEAARIFPPILASHAARLGLQPGLLRLSSARTRWGSCSSAGTISLNWRLVMAPPQVLDYVVIHELAHLIIKNHSRNFWLLVTQWMPDYKSWRVWLKDHGAAFWF